MTTKNMKTATYKTEKPYIDICIEEMMTGDKLEHLTMQETMDFLGIQYSYLKLAIARGCYKNYRITATENKKYEKRKTNNKEKKQKKKEETKQKHGAYAAKYIEIVLKDKNTGETMEFASSAELGKHFGANGSTLCNKGQYKQYEITCKLNPKWYKNTLKKPTNNEQIIVQSKNESALKKCFYALKTLENAKETYNFESVDNLIDWLRKNEFIMNELK